MRRTSLTARIVLATVSVALLAAVATGLVAFQLVRQVSVTQAKQALRSTVQVVSHAPADERAALVRNLDRTAPGGVRLVLVRADGSTVPAASGLPAQALTHLDQSGTVSARYPTGGRTLLVEGSAISARQSVVATRDLALVQTADRRLLERLAIAVGLGVVVAVAVGILVGRLVTQPLRRAAASARALARGRRPPPDGSPRAVGVLLTGAAPTTIVEVADFEQALASLEAALAASEARQHEFLLSVSHEIRTPLTAIRGYADALADGLVSSSAVPGVGRTLVTETTRLEAFTRDLLELARLEADDFRIRPEPLDLVAVVVESATAWRARASSQSVSVSVIAPSPVPLTTDPMRVRQLVDGLVENALRASPAGASVEVAVTGPHGPARPTASVTVRDHGPGLTTADAESAFERGVLRDRYAASRSVGTGLGLSIAARLARRLGGSIAAEPADGGGAAFTVALPAVPPQGFEP